MFQNTDGMCICHNVNGCRDKFKAYLLCSKLLRGKLHQHYILCQQLVHNILKDFELCSRILGGR